MRRQWHQSVCADTSAAHFDGPRANCRHRSEPPDGLMDWPITAFATDRQRPALNFLFDPFTLQLSEWTEGKTEFPAGSSTRRLTSLRTDNLHWSSPSAAVIDCPRPNQIYFLYNLFNWNIRLKSLRNASLIYLFIFFKKSTYCGYRSLEKNSLKIDLSFFHFRVERLKVC